jgi:hypothetical protein
VRVHEGNEGKILREQFSNSLQVLQSLADELISGPRNKIFLYQTNIQGEKELISGIWLFSPYDAEQAIRDEENLRLLKIPGVIEQATEHLMESYLSAVSFFPWTGYIPKGFIVEGMRDHGMSPSEQFGICVSEMELRGLLKGIVEVNAQEIKRQKIHLAASFVHELVHETRDECLGGASEWHEVVSSMAQWLYHPKGNEIFARQVDESLSKLQQVRDENLDERELNHYHKATYIMLVLLLHRFLQFSLQEVVDYFSQDDDPHKFPTLKNLRWLVKTEEIEAYRQKLLEEFLPYDRQALKAAFLEAAEKLGIKIDD